jgi:hypothetical protein
MDAALGNFSSKSSHSAPSDEAASVGDEEGD